MHIPQHNEARTTAQKQADVSARRQERCKFEDLHELNLNNFHLRKDKSDKFIIFA